MKCLGLIGGLTAPTLDVYWQTIRNEAQKNIGADQMPRFLVHSGNTGYLKDCLAQADWSELTGQLVPTDARLPGWERIVS